MKYIVTGCPALEEYKAAINNGSLTFQKMDFCFKMKQPCIKVSCPTKQMILHLKELKRNSDKYDDQYLIQQILDFYNIQEIPEE